MVTKKNTQFGFIMLVAWCLLSAAGDVLTSSVEQAIPALEFCFYLFAFATLAFLLINLKRLPIVAAQIKDQWKYVMIINITSFFCWYFLIYPLKFIEPSIVVAIALASLPIATWIAGIFIYKKQRVCFSDVFFSIAYAIGIIYLSAVCIFDKTGVVNQVSKAHVLLSLILAILGGFILAINTIYAKKLSNVGWKPVDVLVARFWLILLVGGIGSSLNHFAHFHEAILIQIFIAALLLVIGPQLVFQYAVKALEPLSLAMFPPLMPVLVFLIEFLDHRLHPTCWTFIGVSAIGLISIGASLIRYRQEYRYVKNDEPLHSSEFNLKKII